MNSNSTASHDSLPAPVSYVPGQTTIWNKSWQLLYDKMGDVIIAYGRQEGLTDHSCHDVLQEAMMTVLLAQKGEVPGPDLSRGSFGQWLQGVVRNRIRSVRRKDHKESPFSQLVGFNDDEGLQLKEIPQPAPDFSEHEEQQWEKAMWNAALQRVRNRVTAENFAIYTALIEKRAKAQGLATTYGRNRNDIYQIRSRCKALFKQELDAIREAWTNCGQLPS